MPRKVALVFPGAGYSPLGPALHIPVLALSQLGFSVTNVVYPALPDVGDAPFPWDDFSTAVAARIADSIDVADADDVVAVAKSLGTGVLARIGEQLALPRPRAIWLTPLFRNPVTRDGAMRLGWPALLVAGTADEAHDPDALATVADALEAETLLIDDADHGLDIPGDVLATVDGLARLAAATLAFAGVPSRG